ncbi:MAG: hypothetical protein IH989_08410 [Planctomycetes bacterium]|nr:hypothetical protein [Planctomycetota bacterium]
MNNRNFGLLVCVVLTSITGVFADQYAVSISEKNVRIAHVRAEIEADDGLISMNDENVHGLKRGWSTFVENIRANDKDGRQLELTYEPTSRWRIAGAVGGPITLTYDVRLGHDSVNIRFGDNGAAYANDFGVMWAGRALFIAGRPARDVQVRFDLPKAWHVTTPWAVKKNQPNAFVPRGTDDLLNSAFFAGTHMSFDLPTGSATIRFALAGENVRAMRQMFSDQVDKSMRYYESMFGPPPAAEMLFIAADSSYWGGEVMGRVISLSVAEGPVAGFNPLDALAHVISHEIFHLWNSGIEVDDIESGWAEWLGEGFTAEYFSYVAGLRLGDLDENAFLSHMAEHWNLYAAKHNGKLNLMAAGKEKDDNYDLVYSGGFVAAAALDFEIRSATSNAKKLDDLIPLLIKRYPRQAAEGGKSKSAALTMKILLDEVRTLFGESVMQTLKTYVQSPELIPFPRVAALAGLEAKEVGKRITLTRVANPTKSQQAVWMGLRGG